jgi:small subunit ribosomal protein S8
LEYADYVFGNLPIREKFLELERRRGDYMKIRRTITNYPAGDFLIRVKNSSMARRAELSLRSTKFIHAIANALKVEGYLSEVKLAEGTLTAKIAQSHKKPVLMDLRLISKPGLRVYRSIAELKSRKAGSSILILSTPKGIMSNKKAIKANIGGEVIAEIW